MSRVAPLPPPRSKRILDFDCEMRLLSWIGNDYMSAEITAIAASWMDKKVVHVWLLGKHKPEKMLGDFLELYNEADIVTGHYIRKHDLSVLSGAMLEFGFPTLAPKLTWDTQGDIPKHKYLSASQESLTDMWGLNHRKEHMSQPQWRKANRLWTGGLKDTRRRVAGDVREHKELWRYAAENGYLKAPKLWKP